MEIIPNEINMVLMVRLTFPISLAPKYCEITIPKPDPIPIISAISAKIIGNEAPTEAKASLPKTLPTIIVSTT